MKTLPTYILFYRHQIHEAGKTKFTAQHLKEAPTTSYKPVDRHSADVSDLWMYNVFQWLSLPLIPSILSSFLPLSLPTYVLLPVQVEYDKKKKIEMKRARDDKGKVYDLLFNAFQHHQYYTFKDLVNITKQPPVWTPLLSILFLPFSCFKVYLLPMFAFSLPQVYLKELLKELCDYNMKAPHKHMWELKSEYKHTHAPSVDS